MTAVDFPFSTWQVLVPVVAPSVAGVMVDYKIAASVGTAGCNRCIVYIHRGCCCTCRRVEIVGYIVLSGSS